ncbi:hypothetical protein BHM03_00016363 [Ensete ventricosum]|nr:hypothetical protein BHM03_00016363 [Ensete ventricosum]
MLVSLSDSFPTPQHLFPLNGHLPAGLLHRCVALLLNRCRQPHFSTGSDISRSPTQPSCTRASALAAAGHSFRTGAQQRRLCFLLLQRTRASADCCRRPHLLPTAPPLRPSLPSPTAAVATHYRNLLPTVASLAACNPRPLLQPRTATDPLLQQSQSQPKSSPTVAATLPPPLLPPVAVISSPQSQPQPHLPPPCHYHWPDLSSTQPASMLLPPLPHFQPSVPSSLRQRTTLAAATTRRLSISFTRLLPQPPLPHSPLPSLFLPFLPCRRLLAVAVVASPASLALSRAFPCISTTAIANYRIQRCPTSSPQSHPLPATIAAPLQSPLLAALPLLSALTTATCRQSPLPLVAASSFAAAALAATVVSNRALALAPPCCHRYNSLLPVAVFCSLSNPLNCHLHLIHSLNNSHPTSFTDN